MDIPAINTDAGSELIIVLYLHIHSDYDEDGCCTVCGGYQPCEWDGYYYLIRNAGNLYWFAAEGTKVHAHAATIEWESMEFTYTSGGQKWNTEKMIWEDNGAGTWGDASTVKVSNKSSEAITVKFGFTAESDAKGVTGITVNGNAIVADGYTVDAATAGTNGNNGTAADSTFSIRPTGTYTDRG